MQRHRIVYPHGDRSKLTVCCMFDYEESEYDIASRSSYTKEEEAWEQARILAYNYSKELVGDERPTAYLD